MNEDTQKWIITVVAALLAHFVADKIANRYLDEPEERGVRDDVKEAVIKGSFRAGSTILASIIVRNLFSRWSR